MDLYYAAWQVNSRENRLKQRSGQRKFCKLKMRNTTGPARSLVVSASRARLPSPLNAMLTCRIFSVPPASHATTCQHCISGGRGRSFLRFPTSLQLAIPIFTCNISSTNSLKNSILYNHGHVQVHVDHDFSSRTVFVACSLIESSRNYCHSSLLEAPVSLSSRRCQK